MSSILANLPVVLAMMPPPAGEGQQPGIGSFLFPLVLTLGVMYLLILRPQQKRQNDHKKFIDGLKKGDHILTAGGVYGRIWAVEDKILTLEIAPNCRIKVTRDSVASRGRPEQEAPAAEKTGVRS